MAEMLETARDQSYPWLEQVSFFLPNKVGSLERVTHVLDREEVRICGLSILDAHDHAVVRLVVDRPGKAELSLKEQGHQVCMTRILGVTVDEDRGGVSALLSSLLRAELNVFYTYALITRHADSGALALLADDADTAANVLRRGGFRLISQRDLEQGD